MEEHVKIERLLKILQLLSSNVGYNYRQLSEKLGVTERTIRRYLKSFEKAGLFLENNNGYFRFEKNKPNNKDITSLLHFTEEEAEILYEAINSIEKSTLTKINLRDKLYALYNSDRISYPIVHTENSEKVRKLLHAIRQKNQVELINYRSSNTSLINTRIVEPLEFTTNYIHLWAYEPRYKKNLIFRVSRIEDIKVLDIKWEFEDFHQISETDVFRMVGDKKVNVEIEMTLSAYNYLIEHYPLAKKHITKVSNDKYIFLNWYSNAKGISRFILSMINDVKIIKPIELAIYLNEIIKNKKF